MRSVNIYFEVKRVADCATYVAANLRNAFAAFIFTAFFTTALNAQIPPLIFPEGVGVNIHFTRGHEKDLDMIADAGFRFIRMDFGWSSIERKKGEYDWSAYEELTANLEKRGLGAIYILDYSNPLYEETYEVTEGGNVRKELRAPQKPESIAAFARWAGAAASHFKGKKIIWEIWNEPNIFFWRPKPDVHQYIALAKATIKEIRKADPNAKIIAPASSEFPWGFLEEMFKAGLIEELDAISVHPYRSRPPETVVADYQKLRAMVEKYASPAKKNIPIISGEWGYATHNKGIPLELQAAYIVRQQLINLMSGVPLSIWYDWKNDGNDPNYNEHNFGTVTQDLQPKPAYIAIKTATSELKNCRFIRRLPLGNNDVYVLLFNDAAGNQKLAAWTMGNPESVKLKLGINSADNIKITTWDGGDLKPELANGELKLNLTKNPLFISLKTKSPELITAGAWQFENTVSVLVKAGEKDGIHIPLRITNPFDFPALVNIKLVINDTVHNDSLKLNPNKIESRILKSSISRYDIETVNGTVEVEYLDARNNRNLGKWVELLNFTVANSIKIDCVPVEGGLRVIVENPNKTELDAILKAGATERKLRIDKLTESYSTDIPLPQTGKSVSVSLLNQSGQIIGHVPERQYKAIELNELKAYLDGDSKVPAKCALTKTPITGANPPIKEGYCLEYEFENGWRFVRITATGERKAIEGAPQAIGVWVYGDNSKNSLRMRVVDESGQVFQPSGPSMDWAGWRWIKFDLSNLSSAGHWGGANDGVVHGKIKIDTYLIVDGTQKKTSGKIYFGGFYFIY